jgi:hypothetical protein
MGTTESGLRDEAFMNQILKHLTERGVVRINRMSIIPYLHDFNIEQPN